MPTEMSPAASSLYLIDEAYSYFHVGALRAAALLGVADHLAGGPRTAAELGEATGAQPELLTRALRLLTARGIFREEPEGRFHLTPQAQALRTDAPFSARAGIIMATQETLWRCANDMTATLNGAGPAFERNFHMQAFDYFAAHPEVGEVFHRGMMSVTEFASYSCAQAYPFPESGTVVDVGGGLGGWLVYVLQANPGLRGVLFDREHVLAHHRLAEVGADGRWQLAPGDFFTALPEGHDIYAMKYIMHDWPDDACVTILRNARRAMAPHGRVLTMDTLIAADNTPHFGKIMDVAMLVSLGGRERTVPEFESLFAEADLQMTRVIPTQSPVSIIEAVAR
jgi:hypothetical protein